MEIVFKKPAEAVPEMCPDRPQYNMTGWGLPIRNEETALVLCIWREWFPGETSEELERKWCFSISDSIVNILLAQESKDMQNERATWMNEKFNR